MKLLFLTNHSFMFWQFRRELVAALISQGHRVTIGVPFGDHVEDLKDLGCGLVDIPVERRGINPLTDAKLFVRYWKLLSRVRPDMVVTYSIKPNIYAGFACRMRHIPYCVNVQGLGTAFQKPGIAQLVTWMYKVALKKAKTVFFENQPNADLFVRKGITPKAQQTVLRGAGINLQFYTPQPYPDHDRVHFLYLGRLMQEKGIGELFAAARRLQAEGADFFLDLVGFYEDGYKDQVQQLEALGICRFHGFLADPRPCYGDADCVVLPSYHEGMSNVLLEAAATGRPVLTTDIPGCREAVEAGVTGFLCQPRDADSLYEAMVQILALPRERRIAMGEAGRRKIQAEFDKTLVVEQTLAAIMKEETL